MICQYESIELVSRKKNGDIYILENSNPGKHGESEWRILKLSKLGPNEFSYSGERQMDSEKRKKLNDIIENITKKHPEYVVNTDEPVLCLYMSQDDYLNCKRRIENLLPWLDIEKALSASFDIPI